MAASDNSLRTVGLFAGIGGIELGLSRRGHQPRLLCEIDQAASSVLKTRFPDVPLVDDIRSLNRLPACDLVSAGFPCQDLSQCGKTQGIDGKQSSIIHEVFRLIHNAREKPRWLLLENVPFMLHLERGKAMSLIASELKRLGYKWAYRTIDARAFGVPQRRKRIVLLASQTDDPCSVLFGRNLSEPSPGSDPSAYGFYWTEGSTGLGWGVDCVPTLKGGSGLGIPSPPAIWIPELRRIMTIDVRDAERLQGFPANWTKPAVGAGTRKGVRWRLVGNALCVKLSEWLGGRLSKASEWDGQLGDEIEWSGPWPHSAFSDGKRVYQLNSTTFPVRWKNRQILEFLRYEMPYLSARATAGFLSRAKASRLRFAGGFLDDVAHHLQQMS